MTDPAPSGVPPLFSADFALSPWATFAWLQDEAPLFPDPASRMLVLTRYDDCESALRDPGLSAAGGQQERRERSGVPRSMLTTDGPEHDALRRPGARLLGPGAVRELAVRLGPKVDELVGSCATGAPVDLLHDLGEPLATAALAEVLSLELPVDVAELDSHARRVQVNLDPVPDPRTAARGHEAMQAMVPFLQRLLAQAQPGTALAVLAADPTIERADAVGVLSLCIVGGWSPLAEVFTSTARVVLGDEALRAEAATADGAGRLTEEVLRWHSPLPFVARRASAPVSLPSGEVAAGSMVLCMLAAANRDPRAFPDPHVVDVHRGDRAPLALGGGPHFCLGAALVRTVVPMAVTAMLRCSPLDAGVDGPITWLPSIFPRRVRSVPVVLSTTARLTGPADPATGR